jgi:hypothetical protein
MAPHQQHSMGKLSMPDFARQVADGLLTVRDRINRPVKKGDLVAYHNEVDVFFTVTDLVPVMDPRLPGMVRLRLEAMIPLSLPVNRPTMQVLLVGTAEEARQKAGEPPPPADPDTASVAPVPSPSDPEGPADAD